MNDHKPFVRASLRESIQSLNDSEHLGVVVICEAEVIEANDTFLRMVGYSREEMNAGAINWCEITAPEFRHWSKLAWEQAKIYGAYVPFEKEYVRKDGQRLPVLIGGVQLRKEPFEILSWVANLSEQKRAAAAERQAREFEARNRLVNQLAHEINNPLEALTNLLFLLRGERALSPQARQYVEHADLSLARITTLVDALLSEESEAELRLER